MTKDFSGVILQLEDVDEAVVVGLTFDMVEARSPILFLSAHFFIHVVTSQFSFIR